MKMKKFFCILVAVMVMMALSACSAETTTAETTTAETTTAETMKTVQDTLDATAETTTAETMKTVQDTLDATEYPNISGKFSVSDYRDEVTRRLDEAQYWTEKEEAYLETFGLKVSSEYPTGILEEGGKMLHYPAIFRYQDSWVLIYMKNDYTFTPEVRWLGDEPDCNCKEYLQNVVSERGFHVDSFRQVACEHGATKNCYIYVSPYMAIGYCSETGEFAHWSFGQKVATVRLEPGTVYVGNNSVHGDLFRDGSKIIAVKGVRFNDCDPEITVLATDAKCVLLAEYEYSAEQPYGAIMYLNQDNLVRCITPYGECQRPAEHLNGSDEGGQFEMQRWSSTDYDWRYMTGIIK